MCCYNVHFIYKYISKYYVILYNVQRIRNIRYRYIDIDSLCSLHMIYLEGEWLWKPKKILISPRNTLMTCSCQFLFLIQASLSLFKRILYGFFCLFLGVVRFFSNMPVFFFVEQTRSKVQIDLVEEIQNSIMSEFEKVESWLDEPMKGIISCTVESLIWKIWASIMI